MMEDDARTSLTTTDNLCSISATLTEPKKILVTDVTSDDLMEELDFPRDRVVEFALGYDHLVVCTASQCLIYDSPNYNTPQIFDLRNPVNLIVLSQKSFAIVDTVEGIRVFSYEGRQISAPRFQGVRPEFLNEDSVSLSSDTIVILDRTDMKTIKCFDALTGRPIAGGSGDIKHDVEIHKLSLSQYSSSSMDRRLVFVDANRELFITPILPLPGVKKEVRGNSFVRTFHKFPSSSLSNPTSRHTPYPLQFAKQKLATQVDTVAWNDTSDMLSAIADSRLITWFYPHALYVDKDLLPLTQETQDGAEFGKIPQIKTFFGNIITIRRADGALLTSTVPPYPTSLYELVSAGRWDEAVRLCRFVKIPQLWATLAGMAIYHQDLESACTALSAIKEGEGSFMQFTLLHSHN